MSDPAEVRAAATVVVLRDRRAGGVEVLMLRRHRRSGFAADAWVFPGGVVDGGDAALDAACWTGIDPARLAERFAASPREVLGFHVAAVRETFEEAGLLLAHRADGAPVDLADAGLRQMRHALAGHAHGGMPAGGAVAPDGDFGAWLSREGLVLELGALVYHSRWVTPTAERRRYDACFFLARAPLRQIADHDRIETTDQRWLTPAAALNEHQQRRMHLVYPTVKTLQALAAHDRVDALLAAAAAQPHVRSILPHAELDADGRIGRILHPDDADFPHAAYRQDPPERRQ